MFTPTERTHIRHELLAAARADERITAAALVGSAARDAEDRWSDIDLALRLAPELTPAEVIPDWTERIYAQHGAVDHLDMWRGSALYRVFLLDSSLQLDLSLWPAADFAATGAAFRLLFGQANPPAPRSESDPGQLIGLGWLYALHVRSAIPRGRVLQAVYMLGGLRDQLAALACRRHELPAYEGRGVDQLPAPLRERLTATVTGTDPVELRRGLAAGLALLLEEAALVDPGRADRLRAPAGQLIDSV